MGILDGRIVGEYLATESDTAKTLQEKCSKGVLPLLVDTNSCVAGGLEEVSEIKAARAGYFSRLGGPKP